MNFFITGTDTDCGKTYVTALLARAAREAGIDAVAAKPVCCGPRSDVEILASACGNTETLDALNPVWFQTPAAPMACELAGESDADYQAAIGAMRILASRHACVFCEGAGGWLVPLRSAYTMGDFAAELGWPVIVVVRNKLGALNHAMLTLEAIRARGLAIAGLIVNNADAGNETIALSNEKILAQMSRVTLLATVRQGQAAIDYPRQFLLLNEDHSTGSR